MKHEWLNWIWIDWEIPASQRVTDAGALLEALRSYGNPEKPTAAHYVVFRAALDMLPESQVPLGMMPTPSWVEELYQKFLDTVRRERPMWLKAKKGDENRKRFEAAREDQAKQRERLRPLEEAQEKRREDEPSYEERQEKDTVRT